MPQTNQPKPKTPAEIAAERAVPDALCTELLRAQAIKDAEKAAVAAIHAEAVAKREAAAAEREVIEQARKQKLQTEQEELENRRHALSAWEKCNAERRSQGLPPVPFDLYRP
jgi:hypothetical protein